MRREGVPFLLTDSANSCKSREACKPNAPNRQGFDFEALQIRRARQTSGEAPLERRWELTVGRQLFYWERT